MARFDIDGNGEIGYSEFVHAFAPGIQGKEEGGVGIALQQRNEAMQRNEGHPMKGRQNIARKASTRARVRVRVRVQNQCSVHECHQKRLLG